MISRSVLPTNNEAIRSGHHIHCAYKGLEALHRYKPCQPWSVAIIETLHDLHL
jgi:hypothetical protein